MMAVFETHRAFQALTAAGFTERQAQALIDVGSEGYGALATKADIADMATKADIRELELRLRELELRLRLHVGAYVAIAAALVVAILGFLLALFTGQFA
jgi:hypothetical protein